MNAETGDSAVYYLADKVFEPGDVFSSIESNRYEVIIGLDIGHGECVANKYQKDTMGEWRIVPLQLNYECQHTLPTYISVHDDKVLIGEDATVEFDFLQHFKLEPVDWDKPADASGRTFGAMLRCFIRNLWEHILRYDPDLAAIEPSKLLVAVGCPASNSWIQREDQYVELVREATGCEHVVILPESTAAIMTPVLAGGQRVDAGVAIYDMGSSTMDFTYVYLGKRLIARSLRLGGSDIDRAMYRKALRDSGLTPEQIPPQGVNYVLSRLRTIKESYFRTRVDQMPESIHLYEVEPGGTVNRKKVLPFKVDCWVTEEFMREVLWEDRELSLSDPDYQGLSWAQGCRKFMEETRMLIGEDPCEVVILTGGTSFVRDVQDICRVIYGADRVVQERDPSSSVAKGLCYAKGLESRTFRHITDTREALFGVFRQKYEDFLKKLAPDLFDINWEVSRRVFDRLAKEPQKQELGAVQKMIQAAYTDRDKERVEQKALEHLSSTYADCQKLICEAVNQLSARIYGTQLKQPPRLPDYSIDLQNQIGTEANIAAMIRSMKAGSRWMSTMAGVIWVVGVVLLLVGSGVGYILGLLGVGGNIAQTITKWIKQKNPDISASRITKMAEDFNDPKQKARQRAASVSNIVAGLKEDRELREVFDGIVNAQLEIAIGEILFLVYETKPDFR